MSRTFRTQVGIVGAGPAGLLLSHLLRQRGIDSVILESRSRERVEARVRAGQLDSTTVQILTDAGVGGRMLAEGVPNSGVNFYFRGKTHRIDLRAVSGRTLMMYGQREIVRDMVAGLLAADGKILFEVTDVELHGIDSRTPSITFHSEGQEMALECEFIAGCDGYHGICRPAIASVLSTYDVARRFSWLAVLAETKPIAEEVVYACHDRGLALFSLRSRAVARFYLQCPHDEELNAWPVDRIWNEARLRLEGGAFVLNPGPILELRMVRMRSFVAEPMQHGRLFLAGDAAHIVPPSAAKGLNLAVADVYQLAQALQERYRRGDEILLRDYSRIALERVWEGQRFSDWMTRLLHTNINGSAMDRRIQLAELEHLMATEAALGNFVESYVGPKVSI